MVKSLRVVGGLLDYTVSYLGKPRSLTIKMICYNDRHELAPALGVMRPGPASPTSGANIDSVAPEPETRSDHQNLERNTNDLTNTSRFE